MKPRPLQLLKCLYLDAALRPFPIALVLVLWNRYNYSCQLIYKSPAHAVDFHVAWTPYAPDQSPRLLRDHTAMLVSTRNATERQRRPQGLAVADWERLALAWEGTRGKASGSERREEQIAMVSTSQ